MCIGARPIAAAAAALQLASGLDVAAAVSRLVRTDARELHAGAHRAAGVLAQRGGQLVRGDGPREHAGGRVDDHLAHRHRQLRGVAAGAGHQAHPHRPDLVATPPPGDEQPADGGRPGAGAAADVPVVGRRRVRRQHDRGIHPLDRPALSKGTIDGRVEETEITEDRPRCKSYTPKRQALFGTTHLHTGLSFDASIRFVDYANGNNPRGAYRFAQGKAPMNIPEPSGLQPKRRASCNDPATEPLLGGPSRTPCVDQPLDWGAVTDHSEHFGVMGFCKGLLGKDVPESLSMECRMINGFFYEPLRALNPVLGKTMASNAFTQLTIMNDGAISKNTNLPVCNNNPELCAKAELEVWGEVQKAAEEAYDRSDECRFTSFIAYENTSTPLLNNWLVSLPVVEKVALNYAVVLRPVGPALPLSREPWIVLGFLGFAVLLLQGPVIDRLLISSLPGGMMRMRSPGRPRFRRRRASAER